jgi:uncharacterized membrane protein
MNLFQSKHKWTMAAAAAVVLLAAACTREYIEDVNGVCFEQDVLPIFQSNCTQSGCHNSSSHEHGLDYSNYAGIMESVEPGNYKGSEVYRNITRSGEEAMPPSPYNRLTDEQITTIALWIEQGAKNTACSSSTTCDTSNITLSGTVKPILENYCTGCHAGSAPSGNISLTNYNGIKASADNGSLLGSVEHASSFAAMPPDASKLSACQISKIEKWIALGAKND